MPRFQLNPKFTYTQSQDDFGVLSPLYLSSSNDGVINYPNGTAAVFAPLINLPLLGNSHSQRKGQRITVTSIRWKSVLELNYEFRYRVSAFDASTISADSPLSAGNQVKRFFKLRYMVVSFDDDMQVDETLILTWFKRTFCWYGPKYQSVASPLGDPVSVHSNILRVTTPFVAKFNIVADRCFTVSTSHPVLSLDLKIPINKTFVFDEDTQALITPNLWCFIIAPLSWVDMDQVTAYQLANPPAGYSSRTLFHTYNFIKMNFIDL